MDLISFKRTLVQNRIFRLAFLTAKYNPPTGKQVEMEHHFEERINLLLKGDFTRSKFANLNYFGKQ